MKRNGYTDILKVPGITYTRTGKATAWRLDGTLAEFEPNVPRITDAGITIEGQRTNLLARWDPTVAQIASKGNCADVAAPAVAPLPGRNWVALDNSATGAYIYQVGPNAASTAYTISVFVETADGSQPVVGTDTGSGDFGLVMASDLVQSSANYRRVAGNVWLVSATATTRATPTGTNAGVTRYTGQSKRPLKFSGFQLELGSTPSTPIITTGAAATRGSDNLMLEKPTAAGENFTIVVDANIPADTTASLRLFEFDNGNANNRILIQRTLSGSLQMTIFVNAASQTVSVPNVAGARNLRVAVKRSGLVYTMIIGGVKYDRTVESASELSRIFIGSGGGATAPSYGQTRNLTILPYALTDAELINLTK